MTQVSEFLRESHRIDQQIWDAMALRSGETALFCGFPRDLAWIDRARDVGVLVTVIEGDDARIAEHAHLGIDVLRGSTTMIPAKERAYDAAVAFHYLHEIDPSFHAQVVSELARVAGRVVIVEPAPPADPLGKRIAQLYATAKREVGAFENYQPVDYWRKLLSIVKAELALETLTFRRVPPQHAVDETIRLVLRAMAAEDLPDQYLEELRRLASRPGAQLLPLSRYVIIGAAPGGLPVAGAGTKFRPNVSLEDPPAPPPPPAIAPEPAATQPQRREYTPVETAPELPDVVGPGNAAAPVAPANVFAPAPGPKPFVPPPATPPPPAAAAAAAAATFTPRQMNPPPAAAPPGTASPFGGPFAVDDPFADDDLSDTAFGEGASSVTPPARTPGAGWAWEPPEGGATEDDDDF